MPHLSLRRPPPRSLCVSSVPPGGLENGARVRQCPTPSSNTFGEGDARAGSPSPLCHPWPHHQPFTRPFFLASQASIVGGPMVNPGRTRVVAFDPDVAFGFTPR